MKYEIKVEGQRVTTTEVFAVLEIDADSEDQGTIKAREIASRDDFVWKDGDVTSCTIIDAVSIECEISDDVDHLK